jgi:hypothetical protein
MAASEAVRLRSVRPLQWPIIGQAIFRELDRCPPKAGVKSGDVAARFESRLKFKGLGLRCLALRIEKDFA